MRRCRAPAIGVANWDGQANLYVTLNPIKPARLARAANRIVQRAEVTTSDNDALCRRCLILDIDPVRPSGIGSTDAELEDAHVVLEAVTAFLSSQGWPEPVAATSGNGYYKCMARAPGCPWPIFFIADAPYTHLTSASAAL